MIDSPFNFEFDRLQMYFGHPYLVQCPVGQLKITQPSIGEIVRFGEKDFYSMLNVFIGNPTLYRLQLWDSGIDWNKISDYQLFCMLISGLSEKSATKLLFGNIDFQSFSCYPVEDDPEAITLYSHKEKIEINEMTYKCIAEYLRLMFNIYPKVEKAKGKATKEAIIEEERMNLENTSKKEKTGSCSTLLPLISACVNHPGFKYKANELEEIGIVQFMDSVQRLQIYESTVALNSGMYSGMCDLSKVDKKMFNFMREIDEK